MTPRNCIPRRISRVELSAVAVSWRVRGACHPAVVNAEPFVGTEAISAGVYTERELRSFCTRIYRNVYQRRGSELTARDRAIAAWLWSGKEAVVAGCSAAALLGAEWIDPRTPAELVCDRTRPPSLIITRNETLTSGEVAAVNGVPVTSPARTAFDLGRRPGLTVAVIRIDALARATGVTAKDVYPLVHAHRGARGMKQLRRVLPLIDPGAESPQETRTRLVMMRGPAPSADPDRGAQCLGRGVGQDRHGLGGLAGRGGIRRRATLDGSVHPRRRYRSDRRTGATGLAPGAGQRRPATTSARGPGRSGQACFGSRRLSTLTARLQLSTRFSRRPVVTYSLAEEF